MRVTDKMAYNQTTKNLSKNRSDLADLQNQAATQRRINKPSDDPAAAARVLASRTEERGAKQFIKNINTAKGFLEATDQSLAELTEAITRAKELAIQQSSDAGASAETRQAVAAEIKQIYDQAVQIGNRKLGDRFLFSGHQTTTQPFNTMGEYQGDDGDIKLQINKEAFVSMNLSGDKILLGKGLGQDGLIGPRNTVPKDVQELQQHQDLEQQRIEYNQSLESEPVLLRGPAASEARGDRRVSQSRPTAIQDGTNILDALKDFEIALRTNDKEEIQNAIDSMDSAINQVVNSRAQVGARVSSLTAANESLQKTVLDSKTMASQLEDADLFEVVSDINKADSTLKATLETSGKIMNQSLMDFLR
jgi:flagellar hook-associated protein 3 FlgL